MTILRYDGRGLIAGKRVRRTRFLRVHEASNVGVIVSRFRDMGGTTLVVKWDDGSEQLVDSRDVRRLS